MSRYYDIAFLPDEDSLGLGESIRHYRVLSYQDAGLSRGASDDKVADHARYHGAIVITRNVRDFRCVMRDAAQFSSRESCRAGHCHEGGGVVTVAPGLAHFHFERVTRALSINGKSITWEDVFVLNLRIHIDTGERVTVTFLPRCERCLAKHADCQICRELGVSELYESLAAPVTAKLGIVKGGQRHIEEQRS